MSLEGIKRKRLFYSPEDDLYVLREVVGQNPFEDASRWIQVKKNVMDLSGKDFSERSLKERVNLLAQRFSEKAKNDIFKSGIEEEVSEVDDLLYTLLQLINEFKQKKSTTKSCHQKGLNAREEAMKNLTEVNEFLSNQNKNIALNAKENVIIAETTSVNNPANENNFNFLNVEENQNVITNQLVENSKTPAKKSGAIPGAIFTPKRTRNNNSSVKQSSIKFLEKKNERWHEIRKEELALENKKLKIDEDERTKRLELDERRLAIEERRIALEEKRFEMAANRFKAELDIFQNQQRLMEMFSCCIEKNLKK